ncbi:hypothetical protein RH831_09180 [Halodesulfurarchaeum sp. HSR-GB]|uniref:hypothetical protein n=1 Tax=Halodesulfurarchaeum sp. HSR-GB TaxID=3074077 RepID=UPI00285CD11E|nr:hypothetical protein [Halodesulfurarchaeum sp. HSR-GB]MDR5657352.1 hypothetical protein [Halodesulfurarchaeum sp. HSR-GB]
MTEPDGLRVSRRQFLLAAAASGAVVSGGGRTVAEFSDTEQLGVTFGAGELDLDVSWEGEGTETDLGVVSNEGDGGERQIIIDLSEDSNPAWLWFRTGCPRCLPVEEQIQIEFTLRGENGTRLEEFSSGTLREERERYGTGHRFGRVLNPGETWTLTIAWELTESVAGEHGIEFGFDFHAVQRRHLQNPAANAPNWECERCSDDSGSGTEQKDISWVAFAGETNAEVEDFSSVAIDGSTLEYDLGDSATAVQAIALKYGQTLEVFADVPDTGPLTVGEGDETFQKQGNGFEGTDHTNSEPFPNFCWTAKLEAGSNSFESISGCDQ